MMKIKLLVLALSSLSLFSASAEVIQCQASGSTFGIIKIETVTNNNSAISKVTVQNNNGTTTTLPDNRSAIETDGSFQIAPDFYRGPFGIKDTFLTKANSQYRLNTKTFCNFYYQEETCMDGDIIGESFDYSISCF